MGPGSWYLTTKISSGRSDRFLHVKKDSPFDPDRYYVCYACGELLCYRHSMSWHKGHTCDEFDAAKAKNPGFASDATVMEFCKQCPNDRCRTPIMKHEGCDVITCCRFGTHTCAESKGKCDHGGRNYCGQRFCWKCLGKIDIDSKSGAFVRHCKRACQYASLN